MRCDLCDSEMVPWFSVPGDWRKPGTDRSFDIFCCPHDTFARVDPTPTPDVLADHYNIDGYYTHKKRGPRKISSTPMIFRIMSKLAKYADHGVHSIFDEIVPRLPPNARVLDIGAGGGGTLLRFREMGYDVVGIEPDPNAASLQEDFPVPVYQGTGEAIPSEILDQRFDLIICNHVLEHTTSPTAVMRNVFSLLKPGGVFWAEVPNSECLDFRICKLNWQHLGVPRHLSFWNGRSLAIAGKQAGFGKAEILYSHYARQFFWGWVQFGVGMIPFYRDKRAYRISIKQFPRAYHTALFILTVFSPQRLKYDSVVLIATREC